MRRSPRRRLTSYAGPRPCYRRAAYSVLCNGFRRLPAAQHIGIVSLCIRRQALLCNQHTGTFARNLRPLRCRVAFALGLFHCGQVLPSTSVSSAFGSVMRMPHAGAYGRPRRFCSGRIAVWATCTPGSMGFEHLKPLRHRGVQWPGVSPVISSTVDSSHRPGRGRRPESAEYCRAGHPIHAGLWWGSACRCGWRWARR